MTKKNGSKEEKCEIVIDITEYLEDTRRKEIEITSREDILDALIKDGHSTAEVARATLVARELEIAPPDIIRSNKVLVTVAAMNDVSRIAHNKKSIVHTPKGDHFVSDLVTRAASFPYEIDPEEAAIEADDENKEEEKPIDNGLSFVPRKSPESVMRTYDYFRRIIPGHLKDRLVSLYENGEDLHKVADELKAMIDHLVSEII